MKPELPDESSIAASNGGAVAASREVTDGVERPAAPIGAATGAGIAERIAQRVVAAERAVKRTGNRRWGRRFAIAGLLLVGVVILLGVIVQIILWSSLPQRIILAKLESQLGLRTQAHRLSAGWFGAELTDVRLSLPLAQESVVKVPRMRVNYNFLPFLLLFGPDLKSVELDQPDLHLWQSPDGRWNLAEAAELLGRGGGKKQAQTSGAAASSAPRLPAIYINDASVFVSDAHGKSEAIRHVVIRGQPVDALVWSYSVTIPDRLSLVGKLAPGDGWRQEVRINVEPAMADLLKPWVRNAPRVQLKDAVWTGQMQNGGVAGRLDLGLLTVNNFKVSGAIQASVSGGDVRIRPVNLALETGQTLAPRIVLMGGSISYDGKSVNSNALELSASGGVARVDASYDPAVAGGKVTAIWQGLQLSPAAGTTPGPQTSGTLEATLATRLGGRPEVRGKIHTTGWLSAARTWDGQIVLNGDGKSWSDFDWNIVAPKLSLQGEQLASLDGITLQVHQQDHVFDFNFHLPTGAATPGSTPLQPVAGLMRPTVRLASANRGAGVSEALAAAGGAGAGAGKTPLKASAAPSAVASLGPGDQTARKLTGSGKYDGDHGDWSVKIAGQGWPVPQIEDETVGFNVDAGGSKRQIDLRDLSFFVAGVTVQTTGKYVYRDPKPLKVDVDLSHAQGAPQTSAGKISAERAALVAMANGVGKPVGDNEQLVRGDLHGRVRVIGTLKPLDLKIDGNLTGRDVEVRGKGVGDFNGQLHGQGNPTLIEVHSDKFLLLGAKWSLTGIYLFKEGTTTVGLGVQDLFLQDPHFRDLTGRSDMTGTVAAQFSLYVPGLEARSQLLRGTGWLHADNVIGPYFEADAIQATLGLQDGTLAVDPIELTRTAYETKASGEELLARMLPTRAEQAAADLRKTREDALGHIRLKLSTSLSDLHRMTITDLDLDRWPFPIPAAQSALSFSGASKEIELDLPDPASPSPAGRQFHVYSRSLDLSASVLTALPGGQTGTVGNLDVLMEMEGRVIDVRSVQMDLVGATADAQALIDLDHPLLASARLWVRNVDFKKIALVAPAACRVQGQYDLTLSVSPAHNPAALEPLRVDVSLDSRDAHVSGMQLGDARFRFFANLDPSWGLVRLVSQDEQPPKSVGPAPAPRANPAEPNQNTIELAGGRLRVWARFIRNENDAGIKGATSISSQVWFDFHGLQLNQLVHAGAADANQMPGLLSGQFVAYGTTGVKTAGSKVMAPGTDPYAAAAYDATRRGTPDTQPAVKAPFLDRLCRSLYGSGTVDLVDANLANFGPISSLYNLMHIGADKRGPSGHAEVAFRIEQGNLDLTTARYFNRGVEVRAQARVENLAQMPESKVFGTAVGSARPLKDIKLPIFSSILPDVDQLLSALQNGTATVQITGTVHSPIVKVLPFNDIGQGFREFLLGDVRAETKGSASQ